MFLRLLAIPCVIDRPAWGRNVYEDLCCYQTYFWTSFWGNLFVRVGGVCLDSNKGVNWLAIVHSTRCSSNRGSTSLSYVRSRLSRRKHSHDPSDWIRSKFFRINCPDQPQTSAQYMLSKLGICKPHCSIFFDLLLGTSRWDMICSATYRSDEPNPTLPKFGCLQSSIETARKISRSLYLVEHVREFVDWSWEILIYLLAW